ncbi:MAG: hypothetical protein LBC53_07100 [Spirochaetaceae bacterium]|jgi:hypothetical protein|nr:hypothetical protein [Spirochaetaceae bacterium]
MLHFIKVKAGGQSISRECGAQPPAGSAGASSGQSAPGREADGSRFYVMRPFALGEGRFFVETKLYLKISCKGFDREVLFKAYICFIYLAGKEIQGELFCSG